VRIDNLQSAVSANVDRINTLDGKIRHADKKLRAGIAGVTAIANLPQAYQAGKSQIAVAVGAYRGETGYAVGWSHNSENAKHTIKLSVSDNSRSDFSAGVGYGYNY
jgi:hsf